MARRAHLTKVEREICCDSPLNSYQKILVLKIHLHFLPGNHLRDRVHETCAGAELYFLTEHAGTEEVTTELSQICSLKIDNKNMESAESE